MQCSKCSRSALTLPQPDPSVLRFEELPVVLDNAAQACNLPENAISAGLRLEILRDVRKPARRTGCGTALPTTPPVRHRPPRNQTHKHWLDCPTLHKDLESTEVTRESITKLR
ncbi:hypothetical protein L798_12543 [Zootermopsis nevadensis]|uniref:Uncharacterized protein n=1 Tax=Zootermopsis nevadensis TaxID=136037 RepID=A0A067R5L6_ZOONE|nr:hypothetical protein L798_12543 [Zootermopsis nevadensis]